jgi:hypothetical protein
MNYQTKLDEMFSLEHTVLNEITIIPAGSLNRILNQSEVKRVINTSDKGRVGELWKDLTDAIENKNDVKMKKSLAGLIIGYSLMMQFLGQPKNTRLKWLSSFLKSVQTVPKK